MSFPKTRLAKTFWTQLPEIFKGGILLAVVLVAFTYPFFFQGKQFSPMDLLYALPPWKTIAPTWYERASNGLRWDDATKFYPERINMIRNFKQDGMTFWQTDHLLGTPNRPTLHRYQLLFYPLTWLFFLLPFNTANSLIHILNLFIAGISMWLLLREHKLRPISALLGAIVYMLNGFFIAWMSAFSLPGMLALLPLLLFLFERLVRRQQAIYALMMALVIALQFYLGYPPGSLVFLIFFGLYLLVSFVRLCIRGDWGITLRVLGFVSLSMVLAVGLSALYLIPAAQQLASSEYMVHRGQTRFSSMPLEHLLGYLFPNLWGNPTSAMGKVWTGWQNYCEIIAYWGIVPLVVAVLGLVVRNKRGQIYSFAILSLVVAVSLAYGVQPLINLRYLPAITGINPTRWQFGIVLAGSIMAASGMEYLLTLKQHQRTWGLLTVALMGCAFGYVVATVASPASFRAQFSDYPRLIQSHYWQIGLAVVSLILLALYLLLHKRGYGTLVGISVLGLTVVDLLAFGTGFNPYIAEEELYPATPGIHFLQSQVGLYRIAPWGRWLGMFPAYTANVYGIATITGMDHYRDVTYRTFLEPLMSSKALTDAKRYGYVRLDQNLGENHPLLDMLNVRYIVAPPGRGASLQLNAAYLGPDMWVFENPFALPRAWGVPGYELVSNEQALYHVHETDFDARLVALLEQDPGLSMNPSSCDSQALQSEVVGYAQDEVIVHTDFACNGLLVLGERFAPEWQAAVDGETVDVLRANYLLRAVAVPAGQHTIHFRYRPAAQRWGLIITLPTLILFCGWAGFLWKRRRGAVLVGVIAPALIVVFFGRPWKEPSPPSERWVQVDSPERPAVVPNPQEARLKDGEGEIVFLGYELDKTILSPGDTLRLTLYWQNMSAVGGDYTVFTHLEDGEGVMWGQKDRPPLAGAAPTSSWQGNQIVADNYYLEINPNAPAAIAHLAVGMYDWLSGERVPFFDGGGSRLASDQLILDIVIEVRP